MTNNPDSVINSEARIVDNSDLLNELAESGETINEGAQSFSMLLDQFTILGKDEFGTPVIVIGENFEKHVFRHRVYLRYEPTDPANPKSGGNMVIHHETKSGEGLKISPFRLRNSIQRLFHPSKIVTTKIISSLEVKPPLTQGKLQEFRQTLNEEIHKIKNHNFFTSAS